MRRAHFAVSIANIARLCAGWAADTMSRAGLNGEEHEATVRRFISDVRKRLEWIEADVGPAPATTEAGTTGAKTEKSMAGPPSNAAAIKWAVERWQAEVMHRPLVNVHRRSLDDCWRQVIRHFGGDPESLLGPAHDEVVSDLPSPKGDELLESIPPSWNAGAETDTRKLLEKAVGALDYFADAVFNDNGDMTVTGMPFDPEKHILAYQVRRRILAALPAQPGGPAEADELAEIFGDILREAISERGMGWRPRAGNAPGHGHETPGIWDDDNGPLAGQPCKWCATWKRGVDTLQARAKRTAKQQEA